MKVRKANKHRALRGYRAAQARIARLKATYVVRLGKLRRFPWRLYPYQTAILDEMSRAPSRVIFAPPRAGMSMLLQEFYGRPRTFCSEPAAFQNLPKDAQ